MVATFLAKASELKAQGPMALLSPEVKVLQGEGMAAGQAYRARLKAEQAAGKPSSCPPADTKVGGQKFLDHLQTYPQGVRATTSIKTAVADFFIRTYPCK